MSNSNLNSQNKSCIKCGGPMHYTVQLCPHCKWYQPNCVDC
jgi:hypothetical protein